MRDGAGISHGTSAGSSHTTSVGTRAGNSSRVVGLGVGSVLLAGAVAIVAVVAAPLLVALACIGLVAPPARAALGRVAAGGLQLLRDGAAVVALAVLRMVELGLAVLGLSGLVDRRSGSRRVAKATTLLVGWCVRCRLRDRAALLGAPLVAESIPDDLVLDRRVPENRRPVVVVARSTGAADSAVLPHVAVNVHRRSPLVILDGPGIAAQIGDVAVPLALERLRWQGSAGDAPDLDPAVESALLWMHGAEQFDGPDTTAATGMASILSLAPNADVLLVAHKGWPGELSVAHWSARRDEIPGGEAELVPWCARHLVTLDEWIVGDASDG